MMSLIERMRQAREARGLDLHALAARTRLRVQYFEAVDQARWGDLPRGLYARAVVRAYADAVGVDPGAAVAEVTTLLPVAEDPLDGMARVRGCERAQPAREADPIQADPPDALPSGPSGSAADLRRLAAAAAADGAILAGLILVLLLLTAGVARVPVSHALETASAGAGLLASMLVALNFYLLGGIGGATPGERLTGSARVPPVFRGTASAAGRRAARLLLQESSIVAAALSRAWAPASGDTPGARRSGTRWEEPAAAR